MKRLLWLLSLLACAPAPQTRGTSGDDPSGPDAAQVSPDGAVITNDAAIVADADTSPDAADGVDASAPARPTRTPPSGRWMGANVVDGGVLFRLWAPHAESVDLVGTFGQVAMTSVMGGQFEALVPEAQIGNTYRYQVRHQGQSHARTDPYCREIDGDGCRIVDPRTFESTPFVAAKREQSVVYELHVGSFAKDTGQPQGTFEALRARLGELADLGVNVVELMPVQSYGGRTNAWGYNPQLFFAPKPGYGSAAQLAALVSAAHQRGIAMWLDVVYNHADGWDRAPLRCFDGECPNGSAGIYFFPPGDWAGTPWGPRPDYTKPEVAGLILDSFDWWMSEMHGDGFRVDSVSNIRGNDGQGTAPGGPALLRRAADFVHQRGGITVAEDLKGWDQITAPTHRGGFGFDAQWDGFGWTMMDLLSNPSDDGRNLATIESVLRGNYGGDPFARVIWLEDHDTVGNGGARLPTRINPGDPESWASRKRSILGGVMMMTTPGVPMLFQGQEALATVGFTNDPATLPPPTAKGLEVRAFFREMIRLRRNLGGSAGGLSEPGVEILHRNDGARVIAYRRHGDSGEDVVVVANFKNQNYPTYDFGVPTTGPYRVRLDTDWKAYGGDFGGGTHGSVTPTAGPYDGQPYRLRVALAPYSALILTR